MTLADRPESRRAARPLAATLALIAVLLAGCVSSEGSRKEYPPPGTIYPPPSAPGQPPSSYPGSGYPGSGYPAPGQPVPIPTQPQPGADPSTAMIPPNKPLPTYPKSADEISGQAVISLMKQAQKSRAAGQYDQASGALQRAQRIEPRNYFVWSALARVYLDKKDFDNAESVALRSNSLARGNVYVELENWKVIAAARQQQGDAMGALQAQARVDEITRGLGLVGG